MRQRFGSLFSPAMFVALLALMISLSGASVAAVMIHGKQIKKNTVSSAQIKNKTIKRKDISPKARRQLKGRSGADGAPGVPGVKGTDGATGPQGPVGPSNAYSVFNNNATAMTNTRKDVLRLNLTAGNYVVNSKVGAQRTSSGAGAYFGCDLVGGGDLDSVFQQLVDVNQAAAAMANQLTFSIAAPATVTLNCKGAQTTVFWKRMTAIQVGSVSSVPGADVP